MRILITLTSALVCLVFGLTSAAAQTPPSAFDFVKAPTYSGVRLSPNGDFISMVHATTEKKCLNSKGQVSAYTDKCGANNAAYRANYKIVIYDINKRQAVTVLPMPEDIYVQWVRWATNDRLLAGLARRTTSNASGSKASIGGSRVISMPREQGEFVTLFDKSRAKSRANFRLSRVTNLLRNDPEHVIMPAYMIGDLDLWKVNIITGDYERIGVGKPGTFRWFTNNDGKPLLRFDTNLRGTKIFVFAWSDENNSWDQIKTFNIKNRNDNEDSYEFNPVAAAEDPNQIYVIAEEDEDTHRAIKIFDVKTRDYVETVFEHDTYDVGGAIFAVGTGNYAGAWYYADRLQQKFLDKRSQAHFDGLNAFFDNKANLNFLGFDKTGEKSVVYVRGVNDPGSYYLYDLVNARVEPIMVRKEELSNTVLGQAEILNVTVRDGHKITAYLTSPPNAASQNPTPLIVLPHGGPESRDYYDYDTYAQYFAIRGYQVLQVNFRGSSGYGKNFAEAGYGEWGGVMQNDVTDVVRSLHQSGRADPSRTCIVGFSYGGYVALYGAATTPELYKCAASISGASDLNASLSETKREYGSTSETYEYWLESIGDPQTDKEKLAERSPINHVDKISAPILLIHGSEDRIENVKQSRRMHQALQSVGADVEYLELRYEGHRNWNTETDIYVLRSIERFLSENL